MKPQWKGTYGYGDIKEGRDERTGRTYFLRKFTKFEHRQTQTLINRWWRALCVPVAISEDSPGDHIKDEITSHTGDLARSGSDLRYPKRLAALISYVQTTAPEHHYAGIPHIPKRRIDDD